MNKVLAFLNKRKRVIIASLFILVAAVAIVQLDPVQAQRNQAIAVKEGELGFRLPDLSTVLTFAVRIFFIVAGIAALFFGLFGAFSWVTSQGEQENLDKARNRIVAALVGVILIVVVLAVIYTMEQFVFQQRVCFGLSCPVTIPGILEACVPNPQYRSPGLPSELISGDNRPANQAGGAAAARDIITAAAPTDGLSLGIVSELDENLDCCVPLAENQTLYPLPNAVDREGIRLTTGWAADAPNFGNYDYKICCSFGDFDGNQICDEYDYDNQTIVVR